VMREGCKSSGASEAQNSVAVTEEEGVVAGLRKLEEETAFDKYAKATQAEMDRARAHGGLRCGAGQHGRGWAGWAEF
jgi:hypothetical protein